MAEQGTGIDGRLCFPILMPFAGRLVTDVDYGQIIKVYGDVFVWGTALQQQLA